MSFPQHSERDTQAARYLRGDDEDDDVDENTRSQWLQLKLRAIKGILYIRSNVSEAARRRGEEQQQQQ